MDTETQQGDVYRTPDETRTQIESYESEIADLKTRLLVAIKNKKENVPMTAKTRGALATAIVVVVNTADVLTYGSYYAHMSDAMKVCSALAMGGVLIGSIIIGVLFGE